MEQNEDRYKRWQQIRIDQMGKVTNLILGLSTAILGFFINLILTSEFKLNDFQSTIWLFVILSAAFSVFFGIILTLNRLWNFRKTSKIVRLKKKPKSERSDEINNQIEELKSDTEAHGTKTWNYLYWQLGLFILSIVCSILLIICKYSDKLFQ